MQVNECRDLELSFEAHRSLVSRLYAIRAHVVIAATAGLALVGGMAAWQLEDTILLGLTLAGCMFTSALLLLVSRARKSPARTRQELKVNELRFAVATCAASASLSALTTWALFVTDDARVHLAVVALGLAAVATCLRNYLSPRLVKAQLLILLCPASLVLGTREQPIYVALAAGALFLGYVLAQIASGLYREALASIRKDERLNEQNIRFEAALSNMAQGLSMFDRDGRLLVFNERYLGIYGFSSEVIEIGVDLRRLLEHSKEVGNHPSRSVDELVENFATALGVDHYTYLENDLGNGKIVALAHQPLDGGGWVTTHEDITERKMAAERIAHLARHDPLTDLPNRTYFTDTLQQRLDREGRSTGLAVFCLDLDRFKAVNDTLGHAAGDALLKEVVARIRSCASPSDFVARLGGDEFAIIQEVGEQPSAATALASKILRALTDPFPVEGRLITVGVSIGIGLAASHSQDATKLVRSADLALFRAKAEGRNRYCVFAREMDEWLHTRRHLEVDLRRAIANGELRLVYQPIFNAGTCLVRCFEALLRWEHPTKGAILPDDFIPIAEETGLIASIGEWALRTASMETRSWPRRIRLAVNLSPAQISCPNLLPAVTSALAAAQLAPERLELEVTENVLLGHTDAVLARLHALRSMGIKIVMDDFGTGYSSLSNLRAFPFDKIKIDRSFVRDLADPDALAIVRAVRDLGHTFGMSITAEGVETEEQFMQLQAEGCDEVQGYFVGRSLPASQVTAFIRANYLGKAA